MSSAGFPSTLLSIPHFSFTSVHLKCKWALFQEIYEIFTTWNGFWWSPFWASALTCFLLSVPSYSAVMPSITSSGTHRAIISANHSSSFQRWNRNFGRCLKKIILAQCGRLMFLVFRLCSGPFQGFLGGSWILWEQPPPTLSLFRLAKRLPTSQASVEWCPWRSQSQQWPHPTGVLYLLRILEDPSDFDFIDYTVAGICFQSPLLALRVPRRRDWTLSCQPHHTM